MKKKWEVEIQKAKGLPRYMSVSHTYFDEGIKGRVTDTEGKERKEGKI